MKRSILLGVFFLFSCLFVNNAIGASGTRLLKEVKGPDQEIKSTRGMPLIISRKVYTFAVFPENILIERGKSMRFTVVITNPTGEPLDFKLEDVRVFSDQKDLKLLSEDEIVDRAQKDFSKEEEGMSEEQKKLLGPYRKEKIRLLREGLLGSRTLLPNEDVKGIVHIDLPMGSNSLTIEITTPKDTHKFSFNVLEL